MKLLEIFDFDGKERSSKVLALLWVPLEPARESAKRQSYARLRLRKQVNLIGIFDFVRIERPSKVLALLWVRTEPARRSARHMC